MSTAEKIAVRLSIILFCLFLLFMVVMIPFNLWCNPEPDRVLSRMERRDPEAAQEILDNYGEELEAVVAATALLEPGERYGYALNCTNEYGVAGYYEEELQKMPQGLADALRQMERKFPECGEGLELCQGQIGVWLTDDGGGFSILCYPGGNLISYSVTNDEEGTRCLDLGDGWELQMYYAPKG